MAKVGEGDPRWLVQNREDGKNVNNWHWSETDCLAWSKKKITSLLENLTVFEESSVGYLKTKTVTSVSGECTVNIRKGKTIFYYEIEAKVDWEAQLTGSEDVIKGKFDIPYISEEVDDDKMEVNVSTTTSGSSAGKVNDLARAKGIPFVQKKIQEYVISLKEEFTLKRQGAETQATPTPTPAVSTTPTPTPTSSTSSAPKETKKEPAKSTSAPGTKTIKLTETFQASGENIYNMHVRLDMLNAITQGAATMEAKEGGAFSLFGGSVSGTNIKLEPNTKIVQKWRFNTWPAEHYSTVEIDIKQDEGKTKLTLIQKNVPEDDVERTEQGWKGQIWGRGKMMFGFGAPTMF